MKGVIKQASLRTAVQSLPNRVFGGPRFEKLEKKADPPSTGVARRALFLPSLWAKTRAGRTFPAKLLHRWISTRCEATIARTVGPLVSSWPNQVNTTHRPQKLSISGQYDYYGIKQHWNNSHIPDSPHPYSWMGEGKLLSFPRQCERWLIGEPLNSQLQSSPAPRRELNPHVLPTEYECFPAK